MPPHHDPPPTPEPQRTVVAPADWLPGYELLSVVGRGAWGTVFKATQLKLDRVVAVKVIRVDGDLNPVVASRFADEAVTHGKLHHPNIVEVYDSGRHADRMFIAMELLEGEDLGRRLQRDGPLAERVAWAVARQAAAALSHAATLGVVHRDVKPANLFLAAAPSWVGLPRDVPMVKVTDFGLAVRRWADGEADPHRTADGVIVGTPVYMAPEQYRRSPRLDHRADVYALGATVAHALAGRPPFDGPTVWDVMEQKLGGDPRLDPTISAESAELIRAMMAADPNDRPATYEELVARIDRLPALRDDSPPAPPLRRQFGKWRRLGVASATLGAVAVGAFLAGGRGRGEHAPQPGRDAATRYVSAGDHRSLFDGESLGRWLPPASGGVWRAATDEEPDPVLTGVGFTRRTFPPAENYRLALGLDVHEATAAEIHFAIPADAPDTGPRLVLRVSRADGATLGTRDGDRGAFRPRGGPVPFPPPAWFRDRRPYLEVRAERKGGTWEAWFSGQLVGSADDDGRPKAPELRLHAEGGPARVNSVVLTTLTRR